MAVQTYVGSFAKRSGTGTQAITGVGFTPKALLFWSGGATTADTGFENVDMEQYFGFSDGTNHVALSHVSQDGVSPSNTAHGYTNSGAFMVVDLGATLNSVGVVSSLDADGFTFNWTTATGATGILIHFLAIGGSTVLAKVGDVVTPSSTGTQAVTGIGFQPSAVIFSGFPSGTTTPYVHDGFGPNGIGWVTETAQQTLDCDTVMPRNPSSTSRYQRTDRCIAARGAGGVTYQASLTSLDSDGFTVDWDIAKTGRLPYLALAGVDVAIGEISQPAATGLQATTLSLTPQALIVMSTGQAASTSIQTNSRLSFGATDGTRQRVSWSGDNNGVSPTQTARYDATTSVHLAATPAASGASSTKNAEAALSSLDASGFTLNWTTINDSTVRQVFYLAIGTSTTSDRNLLTGDSHHVTGSDNFIAGSRNTVDGHASEAHGELTNVTGTRAVAFGLDGASNTLSEDGKLKIFGDFEVTGTATVPTPVNGTDAANKTYVDGAGTGFWTPVIAASDQDIASSTTLTNDAELFFTMAANVLYEYEAFVVYGSPAGGGTPDFKYQFNGPATFTGASYDPLAAIGLTGGAPGVVNRVGPVAVSIGTATTPQAVRIMGWGYSTTGGTDAGGLILQWAQVTSSGNATRRYAGSVLRYRAMVP
jgi:hypothetical protein